MKFFTATVVTILLAFIAGLYMPWWSIAIASFLVGVLILQKPWKAFFSGFFGLLLLWGGLAYWMDVQNNHILSKRVAELLKMGPSSIAIILATAVIGALVAGFAALSGSYLRLSSGK